MANSHQLFQVYNLKIKLSDEMRRHLIAVRDSLRKRIKDNYRLIPINQREAAELEFQSQGSFVMDTIIRSLTEDFDLDDGVYFKDGLTNNNRPNPNIFHNWVIKAIDNNNEYEKIEDKHACVRVKYKLGFHIDIPIYSDKYECPQLADTSKGWILSNPVEFIEWFENIAQSGFQKSFMYESSKYAESYQKWLDDIRKKDCQIRRIVRYMKAWGDLKKSDMPCGIVMTVLVALNYTPNERDDISFRNTLIKINGFLISNNIQCPRPTTPIGEDLLSNTTDFHKQYFMNSLESLISSATKAIDSPSLEEAANLWKSHFGSRFPSQFTSSPSTPVIEREPDLSALKRAAVINTPWSQSKS